MVVPVNGGFLCVVGFEDSQDFCDALFQNIAYGGDFDTALFRQNKNRSQQGFRPRPQSDHSDSDRIPFLHFIDSPVCMD